MRQDADLADGPAMPGVGEDDLHLAVAPLLAPLAKREDHRQELLSLRGKGIDDSATIPGIRAPLQDSTGDKLRQTVREDVSRNPEAALEFLEMLEAVKRAAKDQERPLLANHFHHRGKRA